MLILITLLYFIQGISSQNVQTCRDQNYCQNGGTCYLTSTLPAVEQCTSDEMFHQGSCYSAVTKTYTWDTAAVMCSERKAELALIDTPEMQMFVATYIQGVLNALDDYDFSTGVWLSIRSVSNGSNPVWVQMPGFHMIKQTFWKQGEPNLYPDWNDVCVLIRKDSNFRDWITQNCDERNYAVCARKLEANDRELTMQCSCPDGYGGQRCEMQDSSVKSSSQCSTDEFSFSCKSGESIIVDYASYGSTEGYKCGGNKPHTCENPNSMKTIYNKCQGLPFCTVPSLSSLFPNTACPVPEEIELQYRFRCSGAPLSSCSSGSFYNSGRCFTLIYESNKGKQVTEDDAVKQCREKGGQLAVDLISSSQTEIVKQIEKKAKDANFWIGLTVKLGKTEWMDGTEMTYMPPDSDLSLMYGCTILKYQNGKSYWKSTDCKERYNYICQTTPTSNTGEDVRPTEPFILEQQNEGVVFKGDGGANIENIFEPRFCPEQTYKGIKYPKTRVCLEHAQPCPNPEKIIGTVVRFCNCKTAQWEPPNTNNCSHKWLADIRNSMNEKGPAEDISFTFQKNLQETVSSQMYGGDILGSVDISSDLLKLAKDQYRELIDRNDRAARTQNFTQNLGDSGDQLLSPAAAIVWDDLDDFRKIKQASQLMSVMEQTSILLATYSLEAKSQKQFINWAMETEQKRPEEYQNSAAGFGANVVPSSMDDEGRESIGAFAGPAAASPIPQFAEAPESIQFGSISRSPIMNLPSTGALKYSSGPSYQEPMGDASFSTNRMMSPMGAAAAPPSLDRSPLHLGYYVFTTFGKLLAPKDRHSIVNSHVIGASVDDATKSIQLPEGQPVTFTFYHINKKDVSNPRCVFWNMTTNEWSTNGCVMLFTDSDKTECSCMHLTSFAILMDFTGNVGGKTGPLSSALDVVSIIGCAISIVCLILSLAVFTFFRSLYNLRNTIHRNLCLCLLIAELTFVIGMDRTSNETGCSVVALLLHYFFLASFCWMFMEGYQLYLMLIQVFEPTKTHVVLYYLFCYGFSAAVVAVSAAVSWKNYGTPDYCWIDTKSSTVWAFIVPIIIVIIANTVFLLIALRVVLSVKSRDRTKGDRVVGWLKGSATLLCLLGITWVFGFLTAVSGGTGTVFAWIFTILNSTQGIFIFVLHVVMNDKVRAVVVRWIRTGVCCMSDSSTAYNSRSQISSRQRILNMVKSNSRSDPSTASTDDKERQLTPTTKTTEWLRRLDESNSLEDGTSTVRSEEQIEDSASTDPRGSQALEVTVDMEKHAPVKRKKFPLGASEEERSSVHRNGVVVQRF